MTKFEVINKLNLQEDISEIEDFMNYWDTYEYMENDSFYHSQVNFKTKVSECVKSNDNRILLTFADHKLYKLTLRIWFKPEDYNLCLANYNELFETIQNEFPYAFKFSTKDDESGEQVGEGYWLYKTEEDKKKKKFQEVLIEYAFEYEKIYDKYEEVWRKTGKIKNYILEISFVDLKETKLDKRGY